jgi:hypothetical protein
MTNELVHEKLIKRKYKRNFNPPQEDILFSIQEKTIGCTQSFVCFQGLPKQGKSLFITSAIASAFTTWDIFGMKLNFPANRKRLCYIDTESSEYDFYKVLARIEKQILSPLPETFDSFLFREDAPKDIMDMVDEYLVTNNDCSILVIDGILDLISDFNSVTESFMLVQWLKKITKIHNLLVLIVLHQSKRDKLSLGHIGSFLDRKSQSVLSVEKNAETKTIDLAPIFLRSADSFNPVSIQYVGDGWSEVQGNFKTNNEAKIYGIELKRLLNSILIEPKNYNALLNDLCESIGKGHTTGKKIIKDWINQNIIIKSGDMYKQKK